MTEASTRFRDFAARLLEHEGVLVEPVEPEGLEALAPARVSEALQMPELMRFGFGAELPTDAERVSLESDWLERFGAVLGKRGQMARVVLRPALPTLANPERIVEHTVVLRNAVYRVTNVAPAWTRYLMMLFRFTAFSDEKREGIVKLGFNLANGSTIDAFDDVLLDAAMTNMEPPEANTPLAATLPPRWSAAQLKVRVTRALPERINTHLTPFLKGMQRRYERDLARVHDYYNDLRDESLRRLPKSSGAEDAARERLRLEAIAREYESKVADLRQKYALRVEVVWSQTLEITMPVVRVEVLVKRRKGERKIKLDWNSLARRLDVPSCEWSYTAETARLVCDEQLHLVSPAAYAPCAHCGKAYCRACHTLRCPKCRQAEE